MRTMLMLAIVTVAAGCGEDPPSCQQAISHYYGAGCALFNAQGQQATEGESVGLCQQLLASAPASCDDDLDSLRLCWGGVKSPASSNADCDCSAETDAVLACE